MGKILLHPYTVASKHSPKRLLIKSKLSYVSYIYQGFYMNYPISSETPKFKRIYENVHLQQKYNANINIY